MTPYETETLGLLVKLWPILVVLATFAFWLGGQSVIVYFLKKRMTELEKTFKESLFRDNMPMFMPMDMCKDRRTQQDLQYGAISQQLSDIKELMHRHLGENQGRRKGEDDCITNK